MLVKTVLFNINQSAGELATNPVFHTRSKHIDIRTDFVCEDNKRGAFVLDIIQMISRKVVISVRKCRNVLCIKWQKSFISWHAFYDSRGFTVAIIPCMPGNPTFWPWVVIYYFSYVGIFEDWQRS